MIIINADDWGRSHVETDAALFCYKEGRITSVSAMVFMEDSRRAADLAKDLKMDVGLHLNLDQRFSGESCAEPLQKYHKHIGRFLSLNKYAFLICNPALQKAFCYDFQAQLDEFLRLYGKPPTHIDGHHHLHLCTNMLLGRIIPRKEKVRRSFSFKPGEKGFLNVLYRRIIDYWLMKRYTVTDYFFALSSCIGAERFMPIAELSKTSVIEIMTHPINRKEFEYLMSDEYIMILDKLEKCTYSCL